MKRIGLSVVLMIGLLFSVSAVTFAAGPYKVDFVGQGVELEQETLEDGQKVSVELQVYTDTGVDRFDAAAILLVYDSSVLRFVRGTTADSGYMVMTSGVYDSDSHCGLLIMNVGMAPPGADRYCCTCKLTMEVADAKALVQAGRTVVNVSVWKQDVNLAAEGETYSLQHTPEKLQVSCTPIVVTAAGVESHAQTVSFNTDTTEVVENMVVEQGETIQLPEPEKEGYHLEGWYTDAGLTERVAEPYTPGGDVTLYAKWTEAAAGTASEAHAVQFNTDGGEPLTAVRVEEGEQAKLPVPEKEGYRFEGWYKDEARTEAVEEDYVPTEDTVLYAKWKQLEGTGTDSETAAGDAGEQAQQGSGFPVVPVVIAVAVVIAAAVVAVILTARRKKEQTHNAD